MVMQRPAKPSMLVRFQPLPPIKLKNKKRQLELSWRFSLGEWIADYGFTTTLPVTLRSAKEIKACGVSAKA